MNLKSLSPKRKSIILGVAVIIALVVAFVLFNPIGKASRDISGQVDPAFAAYVSGYTAGVISKNATIVIQLAQEVESAMPGDEPIAQRLFRFEPEIKGSAYWIDNKTVEFRPAASMQSGQQYVVKFLLSELIEVPKNLSVLEYAFQTITQNYEVSFDGLKVYEASDLKRQKLNGLVSTADNAANAEVEKLLSASQGSKSLKIVWDHAAGENKHAFTIEEIARKEDPEIVKVNADGSAIGVDRKETLEYEIPALGDFKVMEARVVQTPEQYLLIRFSDPVQQNQNLDGLVDIAGLTNLRFIIAENEIRVFPNVRQTGSKRVNLNRNIKNILGYKLQKNFSESVIFEQLKPQVRFTGKGSILPSTDGLVLPFEAVSLKAVEVSVYKVYENNITQFLQVNNFDGSNQLRRVAVPVVRKTLRLDKMGVSDISKWNRYTLDLSGLINKEPGAIYQVKINFNKSHSAYYCSGQEPGDNIVEVNEPESWDTPENENSYWDGYEDYYYYDDYSWNERENPCSNSYYYGSRHLVARNILASDFGLLAKRGDKGELLVVVTDLKTAQPISGVNLEVVDYQKQVIGTNTTDGDGLAKISIDKKPFVLIATQNQQKGYLKLDDGNSLSMSNFDVSGQVVQEGVKGFIYGERGVWRPGDSLHISFMLEDREKILPQNHPVVFELYNPAGQMATRIVRSESVKGIYYFATKTAENDPTGNWKARVKVGGATFEKSLKVETVKANRLKIKLDFEVDRITSGNESVSGELEVKWLHGATAKNLRSVFDVVLTPAVTTFQGYPNHTFDDPSREFYSEKVEAFDGHINDQGKANVNFNLSTTTDPPGALMAYFSGRVYEEGGDFSVDRFSIPYYPYASFVGMRLPEGDHRGMLLTDTTHYIDVVTLDANGKPLSKNNLNVEVYKLDWRWWWDQSSGNASFISTRYQKSIDKSIVNTKDGKGRAKLRVNYPDWGRYYVRICDPGSNHCTGKVVYLDWPGWAGRGKRDVPGGATMLTLSSDKDKYNVGENIKVTMPGSENGKAFVSIENGSKVLKTLWVTTTKGENSFEIEATEDMTPNIFINVSLMQPHNQTSNDLPIRLYGITGVKVENPDTHLNPEISVADVLEPGMNVTIKVSEATGKPMAYTVAVVDEGLLDLTRFKTPDPYTSFYAREALGVKTWDLFDDVIGAYGGRIERLLAIGGDMELKKEEDAKAKRFKPVVKYLGPFYLEKGKTAQHSFTMPQYVGSVRTMVVAGSDGAYGFAEKATPVRQPLMVLATLPRVLGPGESIKLPVNVFAMEKGLGRVEVELKTNKYLIVKGNNKKELTFTDDGDQIVEFDVDVLQETGIGHVEIVARGGNKTSTQKIELDIRNPNPPTSEVFATILEPGKSYNKAFNAIGIAGTNSASFEVSNIPPINLETRIRYLINYPHGCLEQTISSAFPQLYLTDFINLPEEKKKEIDEHIKAAIEKLRSYQLSNGGFAYWPGHGTANDWSSSYVGHFLLEAKNKGYSVPSNMLKNWKEYQRKSANSWVKDSYRYSDLAQCYRLYTLALEGSPATGAMNRLREDGKCTIQAGWSLAAAYALAGQPEAGREIIKGLSTTLPDYREMSYNFGSSLRDKAMILETLVLLGQKEKAAELLIEISNALSSSNRWMSTQETAYCLMAVGKLVSQQQRSGQINAVYSFNNEKELQGKTELPFYTKVLKVKTGQNSFSISNKGSGTVYLRLVNTGTPVAGSEAESSEHITVDVVYRNSAGNVIDPAFIDQGDDIRVDVSVTNSGAKGTLKELALTQIFPSGWEILNARMDETVDVGSSPFDYQDIRDDRVYTYFELPAYKKKTFSLRIIAAYAGRYYLPSVSCEAMYDHSVNARTKGQWVEVASNVEQ